VQKTSGKFQIDDFFAGVAHASFQPHFASQSRLPTSPVNWCMKQPLSHQYRQVIMNIIV
jgi:hypothetical protein